MLAVAPGSPLPALQVPAKRPLPLSAFQKQEWHVEEGLPANNLRMIAQQPDGTLLLATSAGLTSFDGLRFQSPQMEKALPYRGEAVNAILFGAHGELWIGTDGHGVLRQNGNIFTNISEAAGRYNERIRMLYKDSRGVLWIATQNGVERFENGRLEGVAGSGMISGDITAPFAEDGAGGMFFVTSSGLFHWQAGSARKVALPESAGEPTAVSRDAHGLLWVGTMRGLIALDNAGRATALQPLASPVTAMLGSRDGSLWIGTRRSGLYRRSSLGLEHWDSSNGLPDNGVRTLFFDDEGSLWIGMLTGGLSQWREGALEPYGPREGFPASYAGTAFADSHGALWLGTWDKGLFRQTGTRLEHITLPGNPKESPIRAVAEDRAGQVWIGTWFHGVYRFDGKRYVNYLLGNESPGNAVSTILADAAGGLWIGSYEGLLYYPGGVPDVHAKRVLLPHRLITALLETSDGTVLAGTSTGLFRVRHGVAEEVHGLTHPYVLSLFKDSMGSVWAGTLDGLESISGNMAAPLPGTSGLPDLPVYSGIEDKDRQLWLGTPRGLLRLPVAELHRVARGTGETVNWLLLDKSDGMRSSECSGLSRPLSTRMADGTLWFSTTGGFVHTTDAGLQARSAMPVANIRGWAATNNADATELRQTEPALLHAGEPDILLFFWAKRLADASKVEFRYRLKGYESAWTLTRARVARYRQLQPGTYQFEVQARVGGGSWTSAPASLVIRQQPHFYQQWSFRIALSLLLIAAIWGWIRRRVHSRIERAKGSIGMVLEERNRIARECHDTLMAGFAAISWQLEATAKLFRDNHDEDSAAANSCELARSMVTLCQAEARRIIWDLRDSDEVTGSLATALGRMLDRNHDGNAAVTTLQVEGEEVPLAPGCVHHLTCIGQEAVANALRHARPSCVEIVLRYEGDALHLVVKDNGRGFQVHEIDRARHGHFGLAVMEERARKLGGTLRLQSDGVRGTEVAISVPFRALEAGAAREQDVVRWIGL